ncbi:MAG TPA: NTP transferase domain-containing protein [Flavisolibacter sp.]|jgi:molybdenum cofactor guanylyltransferase|nr:NTP transferase domain-containing protein [Flavisolibacter sp.]
MVNLSQTSLNGLVLAGGKSLRMGENKALLQWHGKEQMYYMTDMLKQFCNEVFISCRVDQKNRIDEGYKIITDEFENAGPLAAIVSAFHQNRSCAWLVVASDLPLLDSKTIDFLVQQRDEKLIATTFQSPYNNLPEPLITIWEPKSLPLLERTLSEKKYSPQRVLMNAKIKVLVAPDLNVLLNVNTPEEKEKIAQIFKRSF